MTWNEWLAIAALVVAAIAFFVAVSALGAAERARQDRVGAPEASPSAAAPKAGAPALRLLDQSSLERDER